METLIWIVVAVIVACIVGAVLTWLVRTAPFIPDPIRATVCWAIWAVIVLILLLWFVRGFGGGAGLGYGRRPF